MKKLLLVSFMLLAMASVSLAQMVENFESLTMNYMSGSSDSSSLTVVPNPDPTGVNTTAYVVKFDRRKEGVPWGGFYATLPTPIDLTVNKYVHYKVWKSTITPCKFKLEGMPGGNVEIESMNPQTLVNQWEDMVFDFSDQAAATGLISKIVLMPDFLQPTVDAILYFDQIYINNDSTPNSAPVQVMEDYDCIPLNVMLGGADDLSTMVKILNPDKSGINLSDYVVDFFRDKDGMPWGGFWSPLPTPVDVTTNKYMHVKVWKPRTSPLKFKIEKPGEQHEILSLNDQTLINAWEDIVFDFSAYTGEWTVIAFMPDFLDPVGLTEDIHIYFDDILLNNSASPIVPPVQILNVDMNGIKLLAGDSVWVAGAFGGIYGTWSQPGTNLNCQMTDPDGDSIYTLVMHLPDGLYPFKFFKGEGWGGGEGVSADRTMTVSGDFDHTYKFGIESATLTLKVNMKGSHLAGETVYFAGDFGGVYGVWNEPGTNANNALTAELPLTDSIYSITLALDAGGAYQFKFFKGSGWNGGEWGGDPNRKVNAVGTMTVSALWGFKPATVTFNVNMKGSKLAGETVYVAGNFGGLYGVWNEPGTNANNALTALTPLTDSIYSITMVLDSIGSYQLKFFKGAGWAGGEWEGGSNRVAKVHQDTTFNFKWGSIWGEGMNENSLAGKIQTYPNPVTDLLNISSAVELSQVVITSMIGQEVSRLDNVGIGKRTINISELSTGMYFVTFYGKTGGQYTQKIMKY